MCHLGDIPDTEYELKVNRIHKTLPKKGKYWCYGCDAYLIRKGQKCPICGVRDKSKHQKP
jgi:rubrerythrin